jgi:hypothetical protein
MGRLLVGRDGELATIDERLAARPSGLEVLLIEGEPGIGKTTLWREGVERADRLGYRILSCRAAQAEIRMSFAGLGDLLAHVASDAFAVLPPPQRIAIDRALLRVEAGTGPPTPNAIDAGLFINVHAAGGQPIRFVAGRDLYTAVIVDINPAGVPIIEPIDLLSSSGTDRGSILGICTALEA